MAKAPTVRRRNCRGGELVASIRRSLLAPASTGCQGEPACVLRRTVAREYEHQNFGARLRDLGGGPARRRCSGAGARLGGGRSGGGG